MNPVHPSSSFNNNCVCWSYLTFFPTLHFFLTQCFKVNPRHHFLYLVVFITAVYLLVGKKYSPQQRSANYGHGPMDWLPVFENKVLLAHSHTHSLIHYLSLLSCYMAELSICDRDHMACKAENIYYMALYRKSLMTPDLKKQFSIRRKLYFLLSFILRRGTTQCI